MVEKNSLPLFLEDIYDALRAVTQAAGGPKVIAARLWPLKPLDQARKELLDALNRDNPRKLDPEEVMAVLRAGREIGFHQAKHWLDAELGYEQGPPLDPLDERAQLQRDFIAAVQASERIAERLTKLTQSPLQEVR